MTASSSNSADVLVSVALPVYNGEAYIQAAVESILQQTFTAFEFIVINDGSTDRTSEILDRVARPDPRVRIISRENRGLVASLNEAVNLARGKYIARMDADDVALPDRLQKQVEYMDEHPVCVCLGTNIDLIDQEDRRLKTWEQPSENGAIQNALLKGHTAICHPSALIRADAIKSVGGYRNETYPAEDLDLWLRLGEIGELANLPQTLLRYRLLKQSISGLAAQSGKQRAAAQRACELAYARRGMQSSNFEAYAPWRQTDVLNTAVTNDLEFGWWAYTSGEPATGLHYGWQAWRKMPWSREAAALTLKSGWRVLTGRRNA